MASSPGQYKNVDINPGTQEQIMAQMASIDKAPTQTTQPISATSLSQSQTPINVPAATTPTGAASFQGMLETNYKSSKGQQDTAGKDYADALFGAKGETALNDELYSQKDGVDDREQELNDINQEMLQEQEGLRREIETIQDNAEGLTRSGVAGKIDEIRRKSLRTQADLSVIQLAKQGRFDSAKKIADRAVSVMMEKQRQTLDGLKFIYEESKSQFEKADQRLFDTMFKERERVLQNEEYRMRAEFDQKIKEQDPLYQLQIAKTQKEISLLGEPSVAERKASQAALLEAEASIPVMRDKITAVDLLKKHPGLNSRVGTNPLARTAFGLKDKLSGKGQDFAGGIHKLVGGLTLDNLIAAKARGATFGALSEGELRILANSATAITDWELKDDKNNGTGVWNIDEASFNRELDTIRELTQRAIVQSGKSIIADDEDALINQMYQESAPFNPTAFYTNSSTPSR